VANPVASTSRNCAQAARRPRVQFRVAAGKPADSAALSFRRLTSASGENRRTCAHPASLPVIQKMRIDKRERGNPWAQGDPFDRGGAGNDVLARRESLRPSATETIRSRSIIARQKNRPRHRAASSQALAVLRPANGASGVPCAARPIPERGSARQTGNEPTHALPKPQQRLVAGGWRPLFSTNTRDMHIRPHRPLNQKRGGRRPDSPDHNNHQQQDHPAIPSYGQR